MWSLVCSLVGFAAALAGLYQLAGSGWTWLVGGVVVFVVGGLSGRRA